MTKALVAQAPPAQQVSQALARLQDQLDSALKHRQANDKQWKPSFLFSPNAWTIARPCCAWDSTRTRPTCLLPLPRQPGPFACALIKATAALRCRLQTQRGLLRALRTRGLDSPEGCHRRRAGGIRPAGFDDPGHPGCQARRHRLDRRSLRQIRFRDTSARMPSHSPRISAGTRSTRSWHTRRRVSSFCARPPIPVQRICRILPCRSWKRIRFAAIHSVVPLYEHCPLLPRQWNTGNNIGLVVGATQPEALSRVRSAAPDLWFLVPGVGTQGGDLETALRSGLRADGKGLLINISRGISRAEDPARAAAEMRDAIINIQVCTETLMPVKTYVPCPDPVQKCR